MGGILTEILYTWRSSKHVFHKLVIVLLVRSQSFIMTCTKPVMNNSGHRLQSYVTDCACSGRHQVLSNERCSDPSSDCRLIQRTNSAKQQRTHIADGNPLISRYRVCKQGDAGSRQSAFTWAGRLPPLRDGNHLDSPPNRAATASPDRAREKPVRPRRRRLWRSGVSDEAR
jgi:hypothetical protein